MLTHKARFFLSSIVESSQDSIVTIDFNGTITSWNRAAEQLYGHSASEAIGQNLLTLTFPQNLAEVLRNVEQVKHSRKVEVFDSVRIHKEGQEMTLEVVMSPVKDDAGDVIGVSTIARDVTLNRYLNEALQKSEKSLSAIFTQAAVGLSEIDPDGRFLRVNDELCRILGRGRDELLGLSIREVTHPEDLAKSLAEVQRAYSHHQPVSLDKRYLRPDGSIVWASSHLTPLLVGASEVQSFLVVTSDLTLRRQAEAILKEAHDELEKRVQERTRQLQEEVMEKQQLQTQRNELMRRIVQVQEEERGRIARELHDNLGQHLTAILMAIQALNNQPADLPEGERRASAKDLAGALRDYAHKWKSDDMVVHFSVSSLNKEVRISREAETALYRIMQETLTNVQRHARASLVSIILENMQQSLTLIIEDNGQGFDVKSSTFKNRLGLVGMHERMELVGGTLEIESVIGVGTTVYARVPLDGNSP
jgi:PAS domain S-box-containing protein